MSGGGGGPAPVANLITNPEAGLEVANTPAQTIKPPEIKKPQIVQRPCMYLARFLNERNETMHFFVINVSG